jgi:hypothetical protein
MASHTNMLSNLFFLMIVSLVLLVACENEK